MQATIRQLASGRYSVTVRGQRYTGTFQSCVTFCRNRQASWVCHCPPR